MIRDKYIEAVQGGADGKKYLLDKEIDDETYLRRNFDGTVFIKNGGYINRKVWSITNKTATVINMVLLLIIGFFQVYEGCGGKSGKGQEGKNGLVIQADSLHPQSRLIQKINVDTGKER